MLSVLLFLAAADFRLVSQVYDFTYSPRIANVGDFVAASSDDNRIAVYHRQSMMLVNIISGVHDASYTNTIKGLLRDGDGLIVVAHEGQLVWLKLDGTVTKRARSSLSNIAQAVISPDGKTLVVYDYRSYEVHDLSGSTPPLLVKANTPFLAVAAAFSADGKWFYALGESQAYVTSTQSWGALKPVGPEHTHHQGGGTLAVHPSNGSVCHSVFVDFKLTIECMKGDTALPTLKTQLKHQPLAISYDVKGELLWLRAPDDLLIAIDGKGKQVASQTIGVGAVQTTSAFAPDRSALLAWNRAQNRVIVHDLVTRGTPRSYDMHTSDQYLLARWMGPDLLVTGDDPTLKQHVHRFDLGGGTGLHPLPALYSHAITPDGKTLAAVVNATPPVVQVWRSGAVKPAFELPVDGSLRGLYLSNDAKRVAVGTSKDKKHRFTVYDVASAKQLARFEGSDNDAESALSHDGTLAALAVDGKITVYDVATQQIKGQGPRPMLWELKFSADDRNLITRVKENVHVFGLNAQKRGTYTAKDASMAYFDTTPDGKTLIVFANNQQLAEVDLETMQPRGAPKPFPGEAHGSVSPDGRFVVALARGTIIVMRRETGAVVRYVFRGSEWLAYTDDGYFDGSRDAARFVSFVKGSQVFAMEQFAAARNRPDIILERLGLLTPPLKTYFDKAQQRRLRRLGIAEATLAIDAPTAKLEEAGVKGRTAELNVTCEGSALAAWRLLVNGVPAMAEQKTAGTRFSGKQKLELSAGSNRIELECRNAAGVTSFRPAVVVRYDGEVTPRLFFVGFGVSKYKQPELALALADKDARDLGSVFTKKHAAVKALVFENDKVNAAAFEQAAKLLATATVDDTVVLFAAGHGLHDDKLDYYYLPAAVDVKDLPGTAISFDRFEALFDATQARARLFLMDTCESGEVDPDDKLAQATSTKTVKARSARGLVKKQAAADTSTPKQLNRGLLIDADVARRSGSVVFSSSAGNELSYEDLSVGNGFFTKEILTALASPAADADQDGVVSMFELQRYVQAAVAKRSNDLQHPTIDRDNRYAPLRFEVK